MSIYFGQDIDEKLAQANAYFDPSNGVVGYDWAQHTDTEKKGALNQAEREIDLYKGWDMEEAYSTTDFPISGCKNFRPDFAVFEHAFFILENTARTNTATDGKVMIESEEYQKEEKQTGVTMSPQATRWLGSNRISIQRG